MEDALVNDIKRLRVLTPSDHDNMDDQVTDVEVRESESACRSRIVKASLLLRLDERSAHSSVTNSDGRNGFKSSEDSDSSMDNVMQCYELGSDSDDLENALHHKLNSWRPSTALMVESDSVNENFHPAREQKRKRKLKKMIVNPHPCVASEKQSSKWISLKSDFKCYCSQHSKSSVKAAIGRHANYKRAWHPVHEGVRNFSGKRKRSARERSPECNGTDKRPNCCLKGLTSSSETSTKLPVASCLMDHDGVKQSAEIEPSSSGLSSSESECGVLTNDEGREGDDEQSDCFHETSSEILLDELLSKNKNVFQNRFDIKSYGPRLSQLRNGVFETWKKREITSGRRRLIKFKPVVCHGLKEESSKNDYLQGEVLKNGTKKRRQIASISSNYQISASNCHDVSSTWKMEYEKDRKSVTKLTGCKNCSVRPAVRVKKYGCDSSEVPQEGSQACSSQNMKHPYTISYSFLPAHNHENIPTKLSPETENRIIF